MAAKGLLGQDRLDDPESWLALLPTLETSLEATSYTGALASTLNVLAHVLPLLPPEALQEEPMQPVLWKLAIANEVADWEDLADELDGSCPIVDRTAFEGILNQALESPGRGEWWGAQAEWFQKHFKGKAPSVASRLEADRLDQVLPAAPSRPKPRM